MWAILRIRRCFCLVFNVFMLDTSLRTLLKLCYCANSVRLSVKSLESTLSKLVSCPQSDRSLKSKYLLRFFHDLTLWVTSKLERVHSCFYKRKHCSKLKACTWLVYPLAADTLRVWWHVSNATCNVQGSYILLCAFPNLGVLVHITSNIFEIRTIGIRTRTFV